MAVEVIGVGGGVGGRTYVITSECDFAG